MAPAKSEIESPELRGGDRRVSTLSGFVFVFPICLAPLPLTLIFHKTTERHVRFLVAVGNDDDISPIAFLASETGFLLPSPFLANPIDGLCTFCSCALASFVRFSRLLTFLSPVPPFFR